MVPSDTNLPMMRNMRGKCEVEVEVEVKMMVEVEVEVAYLSHNELPELMITGGKSEPQNLLLRGE